MMTPEQQALFTELGCGDLLLTLREQSFKYEMRWAHAIRLLEDAIDPELKDCPIQYEEWLEMTNNAITQFRNTKSIL